MSSRACVEMVLSFSPPCDDDGLVAVTIDQDGGEDAAQVALFLEFVDLHGYRIWNFLAAQAKDFSRISSAAN